MKSNSDDYPQLVIKSNNFTQIRFNITPFTRTMMDKEQKGYNYEYVEVTGELSRPKIIDSIITSEFTKDAEIALINNEIANPGMPEYKAYQELRARAKNIASTIQT